MARTVFVVDDDPDVRESTCAILSSAGYEVAMFESGPAFLAGMGSKAGCLVTDMRMPQMSGLDLYRELERRGIIIPMIVITGHGEVKLAVQAMKAGAVDFLEKPYQPDALMAGIEKALQIGAGRRSRAAKAQGAQDLLALLTPREKAVFERLVQGSSNKVTAFELAISPRTVEIHRARILEKLHAANLADLVTIAVDARG